MMRRISYVGIIFLLLNIQGVVAYQKAVDTLKEDSYKFYAGKFYENVADSTKAAIYANKYLSKAKTDHDTIKIADGYYFLQCITKREISHKYSDSIIALTKTRSTEFYPSLAYYNKARKYYNEGNFKKSFDYFLKMNEDAKKHNNTVFEYASKRSMGILKSRIGEHEEALETLKDCYAYYSKSKERTPKDYLSVLFSLSDSYNLNKKLDSASVINILGYNESVLLKNEEYNYHFILNEGINQYSKANFTVAKDSLEKVITILEENGDKANLSMAHFYLGKTLFSLNRKSEAIESHKKVDEIFQEISEIMPDNRENYEILISHYKKIGDKDNQLKYIERLIRVDSILNSNYKYLIKNVVQNYDTPRLLSEKQEIIDSLEEERSTNTTQITVVSLLLAFSLGGVGYYYYNQRQYKQRFLKLLDSIKLDVIKTRKEEEVSKDKLGGSTISQNTLDHLFTQLHQFEKKQGYLKPNINAKDLAKSFNSNSSYLSIVVNTYKRKSISQYINDLRIDFAIEKLKGDPKFRKYTIKAISQEAGFNTAEAFSKTFYKKVKIYPSYFIRKLEKQPISFNQKTHKN